MIQTTNITDIVLVEEIGTNNVTNRTLIHDSTNSKIHQVASGSNICDSGAQCLNNFTYTVI